MNSHKTEFFLVPNCMQANLPRGTSGYVDKDLMNVTKPWFKYFVTLVEFLVKNDATNLVFYEEHTAERLATMDKCNILKTLINKTFGFQKPYERLPIDIFTDSNYESASFLPCKAPRATINRRLAELEEAKLIARCKFEDSRIGLFAPKLNNIFCKILLNLRNNLPNSFFNDAENIANEDYYRTKKHMSKRLERIIKLKNSLLSEKNRKYFFKPLSNYIDAFDGVTFHNNNEACIIIEEISLEIFGDLNKSCKENPYYDLSKTEKEEIIEDSRKALKNFKNVSL